MMTEAAIHEQTAYVRQLVETVERACPIKRKPDFVLTPVANDNIPSGAKIYAIGIVVGLWVWAAAALALFLVNPWGTL